jgi:chemotaxis protein CheD
MNTFEAELPAIYLKPGEMFVSDKPASISTVLGSCISVTFFNPRLRIGAICHGLLPMCKKENPCDGSCDEGFRYVDCSIKCMCKTFKSLGIEPSEIEVKIFGGADTIFKDGNTESVGIQNTKIALSMLKDRNLKLKASDTGGSRGRKLIFFSHTGEVLVKRLRGNEIETPL